MAATPTQIETTSPSTLLPTSAKQCPACGRNEGVGAPYSVENRFPLYHCGQCGLGALEISDSEEAFDEYWTEVNQRLYADPAVVAELSAKYEKYYRRIASEIPNKRVLDVGSGAGISIGTAAKLGFDTLGIEPSARAVALSRQQFDVPVVQGLLRIDDDLPTTFGILTLWDVIEHVADPAALITACHRHLARGGALLLETPDEASPFRSVIRTAVRMGLPDLRPNIYYRAHRFYFTRDAMKRLLERCGFERMRFYSEHTMFEKALRKKQLYQGLSPTKGLLMRSVFALLKRLPIMANKMVVVAFKS